MSYFHIGFRFPILFDQFPNTCRYSANGAVFISLLIHVGMSQRLLSPALIHVRRIRPATLIINTHIYTYIYYIIYIYIYTYV